MFGVTTEFERVRLFKLELERLSLPCPYELELFVLRLRSKLLEPVFELLRLYEVDGSVLRVLLIVLGELELRLLFNELELVGLGVRL